MTRGLTWWFEIRESQGYDIVDFVRGCLIEFETSNIMSVMRSLIIALIVPFLCLAATARGQDTLADLVAKVRPSVVTVTVFDKYGKRVAGGTGFCVSTNTVITNKHVIEGAFKADVRLADGKRYYVLETVDVDSDGDLALLRTETLPANVQALSIAKSPPRVGDKVFVVGSPLGLEGSVSDGIVSAFRTVEGIGKLIQITAAISPGSSGSPVVNSWGQVVGVATLNLPGGQNLNFAISAERVLSLWEKRLTIGTDVGREAALNSGSPVPPNWLTLGIEAYESNRDQDALDFLSQAIKTTPSVGTAHHYLGLTLYRLKRYPEAVEPFDTAIRLSFDARSTSVSLFCLGMTYLAIGDRNRATEQYKKLLDVDPSKAQELLASLENLAGYWKTSAYDTYEVIDDGKSVVVKNYYVGNRDVKYEAQWKGDFAIGYVFTEYSKYRFVLKLADGDHIWFWNMGKLNLKDPEDKVLTTAKKVIEKVDPSQIWTRYR